MNIGSLLDYIALFMVIGGVVWHGLSVELGSPEYNFRLRGRILPLKRFFVRNNLEKGEVILGSTRLNLDESVFLKVDDKIFIRKDRVEDLMVRYGKTLVDRGIITLTPGNEDAFDNALDKEGNLKEE